MLSQQTSLLNRMIEHAFSNELFTHPVAYLLARSVGGAQCTLRSNLHEQTAAAASPELGLMRQSGWGRKVSANKNKNKKKTSKVDK